MAKRAVKRTKSQGERKPPSGDTPRAQHFPPPARRGGEDELPIVAIGSVDFEKFCRGLQRIEYPNVVRSELKRGRGVAQYGVDVEGFDDAQIPAVVISCKCYHEANARDLLPWTTDFTKHLNGHWKDKGVKVFVLAVTCDGNDDDINAAARKVAEHLKASNIEFDLWTNQKISDLARKDPGLIGIYFSTYWREAFSPRSHGAEGIAVPGTASANLATSLAIAALSKAVSARLSERDGAIAKRLDEAQAAFRAGRVTALKACLDDIQGNASVWDTLDSNVRAKTARARALLALHEGDATAALKAINEADEYAAPADRSLRMSVLRASETTQAALNFAGEAKSEREAEVKASLFLEMGRVDDALLELDRIPADRHESQRLRAIALCLNGHRDKAIALATAARKAEPHSVLSQQTLAILHVMAALSPRAELQFGTMPNPIDAGLVRGTQDALDHLLDAEGLFSHLAATLELPAKRDAEIWRLASLILHPDKRADARKLGRELLARENIEPLAVAWCHFAGLLVRHGHIRKVLGDALRQGHGSPSHIVVDALLAASKDGPAAAVAVIDRHTDLFPKDADFLGGWRKRFTGDDDVILAAMSNADDVGRFGALADKIMSGDHLDDAVLASAEVMAGNGAWAHVFSIQARLITVGTPRAIVVAANAAFYCGHYEEALRLLSDHKGRFRHGELPPSLIDLKARAHDALGDKKSAIVGLEQAVAQTNNPEVRKRLMQTYLGVGNLGSARHHAEQFVFEKTTHPNDVIALAEKFKGFDRDFSRRLVVHAANNPRFPVQAAPHAFVLACQLGLKDVEERLAPIVFDVKKYGRKTGVVVIDSVEAMIAQMSERVESIRQSLMAWLKGNQCSHGTWSNDVRTFVLLYLGEPEDRRDSVGEKVPMLLSSAGVVRPTPPSSESKPVLVLDISALLLAARLQLVDALTRAFTIKIPDAVVPAILQMEDAMPSHSERSLAAARKILSDVDIGLRIVVQAPADAIDLADIDDPSKPNPDVLAKVLNEAVSRGRLARTSADTAAQQFAFQLNAVSSAELPAGLVVARGLALRLAEFGILQAVCRTVATHWTEEDRAALAADIVHCERMHSYRQLLERLRTSVADRLQESRWTVLPRRFDPKLEARRAKLRPHVLSWVETAGALESGMAGLYWIEDRYVQRCVDPRLVSVMQVLGMLTEGGVITIAERDARLAELRRIGYGFQVPDIDAIVCDVVSAPIAGEHVTETPELAAWRTWFAGEVELLEYCDRTPAQDDDGRLIGEARHTLDVMAIAHKALWAIWRSRDQSDTEKMIRSSWIWTNLRVEQMPFFPCVEANPDGATLLVASTIAHIADVPLLALTQGDEAVIGPAKFFLSWLFKAIVDPHCAIDAKFEAQFVAQLVNTIIAVLGWVEGNTQEADRQAAHVHIRRQVNNYLNLLPIGWRDRLLADAELGRQSQIATVLTATLDVFEFDAVQLAEKVTAVVSAIEEACEIQQELEDRQGKKLILRVVGNGKNLPRVTLESNDKTQNLDPVVVALHQTCQEQRIEALMETEKDLDAPPQDRELWLQNVAAQDTVADRIRGLLALYEKDFSFICRRVREAVRRRQSVARGDLTLPEPAMLQAYLRMTAADELDMSTLPDQLFARLHAELGPEEAVARFAGCPFKLGEETVAYIEAVVVETVGAGRLNNLRIDTGLEGLLYLRGCKNQGKEASEAITTQLLDRLVQQESLFIALLSHAAGRMERDASWAKQPREIAALLIWVWADRLTAALVGGGADPEGGAKTIAGDANVRLTDIIDAESMPGWWKETARAPVTGRLLTSVVAEAVSLVTSDQIGGETQKRLWEVSGHILGDAWIPRLDASFPPEPGPTGYWPAEDAVAKIAKRGLVKVAAPFNIRVADDFVRGVLGEEIDDAQLPVIFSILSFVNTAQITRECAQYMRERLPALSSRQRPDVSTPGYRRYLAMMAEILAVTGALKDGEVLIAEHARKLAAQWPDVEIGADVFESHTEPHQAVSMLIEMVLAFARHRNEPLTDKIRWIGSSTEMIVQAWPKSVRGALTFLDRSIARLRVRDAVPLWPTFNRLRALSKRKSSYLST